MPNKTTFTNVLYFLSRNRDACDEIAEALDIEADGGDAPGAFVQDSMKLLIKQRRRRRLERQLAGLQEPPQ